MNISIVTCSNAINYGARLQCYALCKWLREQGHEIHVADYRPEYMDAQGGLLYWPGMNFKEWVKLFLQVKTRINENTRINEFRKFSEKYIPLTSLVYHSSYEMRKYPPEADVYIAGSDQIWNPTLRNGYDPIFYLDFGNKEVKRISYAASFGVDEISDEAAKFIHGYLPRLDAISVREKSGQKILTALGFESELVCDPAFLLTSSQWEEIMEAPRSHGEHGVPDGHEKEEGPLINTNYHSLKRTTNYSDLTDSTWEKSHVKSVKNGKKNLPDFANLTWEKSHVKSVKNGKKNLSDFANLTWEKSHIKGVKNGKKNLSDFVNLTWEKSHIKGVKSGETNSTSLTNLTWDEKFLLVYDQMGSREIAEVAQRVAKERGLKIWSIGVRKLRYAERNFLVEGPEVWLWLVRHASVVVSNSFHACVFSIIFRREFLLVKRGDGLNSRMTEFLGEMGLSERVVEAGGEMPGGIDWEAVHGRLDPFIEHSKAWLTSQTSC